MSAWILTIPPHQRLELACAWALLGVAALIMLDAFHDSWPRGGGYV